MKFDEPGSLMEKTLALIKKDERSVLELYRDTGLPFYWLKKLAAGKFANPSVNRVQYLYEYLSGKKIV